MSDQEKAKRPQDKWDEKAGLISKSYKIKRSTAEAFKEACDAQGIAMGPQVEKMMKEFIKKSKEMLD